MRLTLTALGLAMSALLAWRIPHTRADVAALHGHDVDTVMAGASTLLLSLVCAYGLVVMIGSWRAQYSSTWTSIMARCAPAAVRTLATASLAAAIGISQPSSAIDAPRDLHGVEFPDRPMSPAHPPADDPPAQQAPAQENPGHAVRPGESLWTIAAATLPHDATDAQIRRAWHAWWDTNRRTIGPDPDMIHPGQILHPPSKDTR